MVKTDPGRLLAAFDRLALRLVKSQALEALVWNLAESLGVDFGFPDCVIYMLDGSELFQVAAYGPKSPARGTIVSPIRIPLGDGITGSAAADRRPIRVGDVREEPRYIPDVYSGRSELAVPIIFADSVLGVIDTESEDVDFFGPEAEAVLVTVSRLIAPRIATALEKTRRRGAEQGLRASELRFADLVETLEGIVWECDPEDLGFRFVSRKAVELLGRPLATWTDSFGTWLESVHPDDRGLAESVRREAATKGCAGVEEYRLVRLDGTEIWVRDSVAPTFVDGRLIALRGVILDVTDRRREHARAISADRAKSRFMANMSHELRTPLHGIVGLTEQLLQEDLLPKAKNALRLIESAADSLRGWMDDLLELAELDSGKICLESEPFSIRRLVEDLVDLYGIRGRQKGLAIGLEVGPKLPDFVLGDAHRVRQVLAQVVGNAVKFTEHGWVRVDARKDRDGVRLRVSDSGPGIPPEHMDSVFERFFQLESTAARQSPGAGLGLAIAKELTELMGGDISIAARDAGAEILIWLPLGAATRELRSAPTGMMPGPTATGRILVAEDNELNQILASQFLEHLGYSVELARNGRQALMLLETRPAGWYQAILMDCQMPELDGYDATRRIRRSESSYRDLPILAVTAHASASDRQRCLDAGMDEYLAKPYRLEDLRTKLAELLG